MTDDAQSDAVKIAQDVDALDELAKHTNWELLCGPGDEDESQPWGWRVYSVNGSVNDREWTLLGAGYTPRAAINAALEKSNCQTTQSNLHKPQSASDSFAENENESMVPQPQVDVLKKARELRAAIREAGVKRNTPGLYAAVMAFDVALAALEKST